MELIDTIEEIRKANSAITIGLDLESVDSFLKQGINEHLIPAIGKEQFDVLISGKTVFTTEKKEYSVIQLLQTAAVGFMLAYYSDSGSVQISSAGIHVVKGNNTLPASDTKIRALRKQGFSDGFRSLEYAIAILKYYPDVFETYHRSKNKEQNLSRLINNSQDFTDAGIMVTPHLFQSLKMFIQNCEDDLIAPLLGESLFKHLKQLIKSSGGTEKEKELITKASEIVARIAMTEAIRYVPMTIRSSGGFDLKDDPDIQILSTDNRLTGAIISFQANAESKLESLRKWLAKNHLEFPDYNVPGKVKLNDDPCSNVYIL